MTKKERLSDWLINEFQSNFSIGFNATNQFLIKVFIDQVIFLKLRVWGWVQYKNRLRSDFAVIPTAHQVV